MFVQKVEQYTQGRYKVQIYPAGQLANDPKGVEQLQLGGIDFTVTGTGTYATHIPTLNLTALPFLVESYPQGWTLYDDSKWMQEQFAKGPSQKRVSDTQMQCALCLDRDLRKASTEGVSAIRLGMDSRTKS